MNQIYRRESAICSKQQRFAIALLNLQTSGWQVMQYEIRFGDRLWQQLSVINQ
ncbi:MAG: hypothetical protein WA919_30265 [Coleofasciculaceae cyanobacterium]